MTTASKSMVSLKRIERGDQTVYLIMAAPAIFIVIAFIFFPMFYSIFLSLTNYSLRRANVDFVGLRNYVKFFTDPASYMVLKKTLPRTPSGKQFQVPANIRTECHGRLYIL